MAMKSAERMKKYQEKSKEDKVQHEVAKVKGRIRSNSVRIKLTGASLEHFLAKNRRHQQNFQETKEES